MLSILKMSLFFTFLQCFYLLLNFLQKKNNFHIFLILGFNILVLVCGYFNIICSFKYFIYILIGTNISTNIYDLYKNNFKKS